MIGKGSHIFKVAWRNIWRNPRRTGFTVMALLVGVLCLVFARSFIAGLILNASDAVINMQAGHIRLVEQEYLRLERIMPKEKLLQGVKNLQIQLMAHGNTEITAIQQRLNFNVLCSAGLQSETAIGMGIEPVAADKTLLLSRALKAGTYFNKIGTDNQLLIGKTLAQKLKVRVGNEVLLVTTDINYSTFALPFRVQGIFETGFGFQDKHMVYLPLATAQRMLDCADAAHELLIFLKNPHKAIAVTQQLKKFLPPGLALVPWQYNDMLSRMLPLMENIYEKILGLIMFIVALVILNTMLMAVMERYHEIGVLKALGFKNSEVVAMILIEAFYIGVIGSCIGGLFGTLISTVLEKTGIDLTRMGGQNFWSHVDFPVPLLGTVIYPHFTYTILFGAMLFGIGVALLAVLYPAYKAATMMPVEAFRAQLKV